MDHPNTGHLKLRGHQNDVASHDRVGQHQAHLTHRSGQVWQMPAGVVLMFGLGELEAIPLVV